MALAAALRRGRRRRSAARQDASARHAAPFDRDGSRGPGADLLGAAGRGHSLDWSCRSSCCRDLVTGRAADLGRSPPPAASSAHVQALARSAFAAKVEDVVGLYMDPPAHAVVLSIDEKSQIQALERTRPDRPLAPGHPAAQTHDYTRHGTTTLFAALDVLAGTVLGRCMQRHRNSEFVRFLNAVEATVPPGKAIHAILDNVATHKHPKVRAWLARHPRWTFRFTPTSASWLNAVKGFFSALTRRWLRRGRRGSFTGVVDLQAAIKRYIAEHNRRFRPSPGPNPPPTSSPPSADPLNHPSESMR